MWTHTFRLYSKFCVTAPMFSRTVRTVGNRTLIDDSFKNSVSPFSCFAPQSSYKIRQSLWANAQVAFTRQYCSGKMDNAAKSDQINFQELNKEDKEEDKWYNGKNAWKVGLGSLTIAGLIGAGSFLFLYGAPITDQDGSEVPDEFSHLPSWQAYFKRAMKEFHFLKKMIQDPASEKLLPDRPSEIFMPPYTLVLEMTGVLVHPDWTLANGWRFKKRPALDYFLENVGKNFEVVIYTHEPGMIVHPVLENMDPNRFIMFRLYREATKYADGAHKKDLSVLNRDPKKIIVIDCDPKAISLQPENGILLQKWSGDESDRKLIDLANFLGVIAYNNVDDVRTVLEYYSQFNDPIEAFKERQKILQDVPNQKEKPKSGGILSSKNWSFNVRGQKS